MNKKKIILITSITSLALLGLLVLQVNWVFQSAKLESSQFDHRVSMALHSVSEKITKFNIRDDKAYISSEASKSEIDNYLQEINLDSILSRALSVYKIELDFKYELIDDVNKICSGSEFRCMLNCHQKSKNDLNGIYELRVHFPDKSHYVFSKLWPMIIASISVILIGIIGFIFTARALWRQRKYHDMTIDFVNNMTHEFKTPISTISLSTNLIRKKLDVKSGSDEEKYLNMISEENEKLKTQVERILQLSSIERGEYKLNKSLTSVNEIIVGVVKKYDLLLSERKGEISLDLDNDISINLDPVYISDAISNLIDNAIKYSPNVPEIKVSTKKADSKLKIIVTDNGIGITREKQKHIFRKFYRVPTGDVHDVKGYGLGLSYVDLIIKAHNGAISVSSQSGKGSTFTIELPLND